MDTNFLTRPPHLMVSSRRIDQANSTSVGQLFDIQTWAKSINVTLSSIASAFIEKLTLIICPASVRFLLTPTIDLPGQ